MQEQLEFDFRPTIPVYLDEYLWLKWFHDNIDMGNRHDMIHFAMRKRYEHETGNTVPGEWRLKDEEADHSR